MRPNFFFGSATYIQLDWLFTELPCTTTDTLTIQNIEPTTNTKYLDLRKKRVKWRCDEIWKLHNIKLNLISTLSLIDGWFHYAYTFSVKIKKNRFHEMKSISFGSGCENSICIKSFTFFEKRSLISSSEWDSGQFNSFKHSLSYITKRIHVEKTLKYTCTCTEH